MAKKRDLQELDLVSKELSELKKQAAHVASIDPKKAKQKKMYLTAQYYVSYTKFSGEMQFDVCEVYLNDDNTLSKINYIENAFNG